MNQKQFQESPFHPSLYEPNQLNNFEIKSYGNIGENNNESNICANPNLNQEKIPTSEIIEKENENPEENDKNFLAKKIIDLSFLDLDNSEPKDNEIYYNKINNIPSKENNINYNTQFENIYTDENNSNKDLKINQDIYQMMLINNMNPNFYYNNFSLKGYNNSVQNYLQFNNQNILNQTYWQKNSVPTPKKNYDNKFLINIIDIKTNKEKRTTIRMLNIPSYFRPLDLAKKIDEKFGISPQKENRIYDFIYIPFKKNKNRKESLNSGYAFINFVHPKHILKFYTYFHGKHLKSKSSGKVCIITFALKQGACIKCNNSEQEDNDKYMFFTDTKNHYKLLAD